MSETGGLYGLPVSFFIGPYVASWMVEARLVGTHPGSFRWKSFTVAPPEEGMSVISVAIRVTGQALQGGMSVTAGEHYSEGQETHPGSFRWESFTVAPPEEGMSVISVFWASP
jgi:hypothetical protein